MGTVGWTIVTARLLASTADVAVPIAIALSVLASCRLQHVLKRSGFFRGSLLDLLTWRGNRELRSAARTWAAAGNKGSFDWLIWKCLQANEVFVALILGALVFVKLLD